ncbi:Uma2 family endonuclease [Leptolyngbya sp. AN03gr2]|uniref:Uma2 family endonuclease n=1 Tax=unclassified Leptolyngbya TaxID=2650499 RepID=UPI003D3122BD
MRWQDVLNDPNLQDLPFKIELNQWGQVVMSPAKPKHNIYQGIIQNRLNALLTGGLALPELAIQTADGVKVADVVWASNARLDQLEEEEVASIAPEICIEVKSGSNTIEEMLTKKNLYLEAGAIEAWLCDQAGNLKFFDRTGELERSRIVPDFPDRIQRRS